MTRILRAGGAREQQRSEELFEQRFLADLSRALVASIDIDATLGEVTRRVVDVVADVCIIDIVTDGQLERRAAAHREVAHAPAVQALLEHRPDFAGVAERAHAFRSRETHVVPAALATDELGLDEEDAQLLWALGVRSVAAVPLVAGNVVHGIMTLGASTNLATRLTLIRELADRTASALERARLFAELHDANTALAEALAEAERQGLQAETVRAALLQAQVELEARIAERTVELARANEALSAEIEERKRDAVARSELLRQLASAEEDERRRIARELHDQMGQLVTALQLGLKSLELGANAADSRARIVELEKLAERIARETQHLALELRPPALDRLGLAPALQTHLEEWSERTSISCDFHSAGVTGARLPAEVETALYRVIQEGLTNVLKHSDATHVSLIVERRQGYVGAILEDNGQGFDVEAALASPAKAKRLGLRGMRERVALLDGTLEIESSSNAGTTLFVRVPDGR
jgi:signal transduction histidine kinase